jgi:hypothetical protein
MSEKCYYLNDDMNECDICSRNNGYNRIPPDECDDCGEFFCSKHLKKHKKDGFCEKIQQGYNEYNDDEIALIKKVKEEERKRIKEFITNYWLTQLERDSKKWKGKDKGNECHAGYLIFTNGDDENILKEIEKTEGKK